MYDHRSERVYRVGELAKQSGVPTSTLRDWYKQGFIGLRTSEGGHRLFSDRDLRWVMHARDLVQGHYMTAELASTISSLVAADEQFARLDHPAHPSMLRNDPNYRRMLDLASQNARLFGKQRELAEQLERVACDLAVSQEAYKSAVERIPECLWSAEIQPSGTLTFRLCTPAIGSITGFPPEVFFTEPARWFNMVHPEDQAEMNEIFGRAIDGESLEVEYRIVRADGVTRWVHNSIQPSLDATCRRVTRLDGVLADVTARKLAELSLRASEQKLRLAVESFPDTIYTQDMELRYTSVVNPQFDIIPEQMLGRTASEFMPPEEAAKHDSIRKRVLVTGQPAREVKSVTLGGKTRFREAVVTPLRGLNGETEGIITYSRDVTDQVLREQELRRSLAALQDLLEALRNSQGNAPSNGGEASGDLSWLKYHAFLDHREPP